VIHDFLDTARSELVVVENTTSAQSLVQFTDFLLQQTSALSV